MTTKNIYPEFCRNQVLENEIEILRSITSAERDAQWSILYDLPLVPKSVLCIDDDEILTFDLIAKRLAGITKLVMADYRHALSEIEEDDLDQRDFEEEILALYLDRLNTAARDLQKELAAQEAKMATV